MNIKIALAGNPNCGKTTLFNSLTGANQYVGNWPGVTVEKKEGKLKGYKDVIIQDLPGIYSLSPYTLEEVVARNYLVKEQPDAILNIVDGTNIERNLYLTCLLYTSLYVRTNSRGEALVCVVAWKPVLPGADRLVSALRECEPGEMCIRDRRYPGLYQRRKGADGGGQGHRFPL